MRALKYQWNGEFASDEVSFTLDVSSGRLCLAVKLPRSAQGHPNAIENTFTPELWKWDVGELFLSGSNGRYVEINLAPNGAWWMQGFSNVRIQDENFERDRFSVNSDISGFSVCIRALENYLGIIDGWKCNVTAIIKSPNYEYLSMIKLPAKEADFHQPDTFLPFYEVLNTK